MKRWPLLILGLVLALVLVVVLTAIANRRPQRTPSSFELPQGFRGWAMVEFQRAECPPLPLENGRLVHRFDAAGRLCTSSELQDGWARDEYWFTGGGPGAAHEAIRVTSWGGGGLIWYAANGICGVAGKPGRVFLHFYVGPEAGPHPKSDPCKN